MFVTTLLSDEYMSIRVCYLFIGISANQLKEEVIEILQNSDLTVLTRKAIQNQLESRHGIE